MKKQFPFFVFICTSCYFFLNCNNASTTKTDNDSTQQSANKYSGYATQVEWGKHLTTVNGCGDCHSPKKITAQGPVQDSSLLFSGHPAQMPAPSLMPEQLKQGLAATNDLTSWIGPWGISYAANITPDSSGIGSWTAEQFITCLREGVYKGIKGSRPIMPPMPIESTRNMTDDELNAIFAYLKSVKPIHNTVPQYQPPAGAPQ